MVSKVWMSLAVATVAGLVLLVSAGDDCAEDFCQTAKFKCVAVEPCNGTVLPNGPGKCDCCPRCVPFRGEGETCDQEELPDPKSKTGGAASKSPAEPAKDSKVDLSAKTEEKKEAKRSGNACRPGLTCLQGTCVVIF